MGISSFLRLSHLHACTWAECDYVVSTLQFNKQKFSVTCSYFSHALKTMHVHVHMCRVFPRVAYVVIGASNRMGSYNIHVLSSTPVGCGTGLLLSHTSQHLLHSYTFCTPVQCHVPREQRCYWDSHMYSWTSEEGTLWGQSIFPL